MSTLRPRPEPGSAGQPEPAVQPGQPVPPVQLAGASPELQAAVEAVLGAGVATLTLEDALAQLAKGPPPGCLLVALADGEGPGPWRALLERAAAPVPLVGLAGPGQEALAARWLDEGGDEVVPPGALALLPALLRRLERRRHAARDVRLDEREGDAQSRPRNPGRESHPSTATHGMPPKRRATPSGD